MIGPMTRRQALRRTAGAAALGVGLGARPALAARRDPVAIIGAGAGGIAAAYFLAGTHHVEIFEARSRIGGHADSRVVTYGGQRVTVDLGAQFFHPDTHPIYVTLLEQAGLAGETHASPGSLTVFPYGGGPPRLTSTHPLETPANAVGFATFTQLARQAVLDDLPWETTVDQWIGGLALDASFKADVLYPWITATIGCSRADAAKVSARSILQTFALAFPADLAAGATTYNSKIGLQGNLQRLLDLAASAKVHLNTPVHTLARTREGWFVNRRGPYRHVVMNAPPQASRALLRPLAAFRAVTDLLDRQRTFDSRLVIHRDPIYVDADRHNWTAYNAEVDGTETEGSAWIGALHDPLPSGQPIDLFKSWTERRRTQPRQVLVQRRFKHPLITPASLAATRALRAHQGHLGLSFSGAHTTGSDLQETAVYSAMQVARAIAPTSRTLAALQARLDAKGLGHVSYAL